MKLINSIDAMIGPKGSGKTFLASGMFGRASRAIAWNSAMDIEFQARATDHFSGGKNEAAKIWEIVKHTDAKFRVEFVPKDFVYNSARTRLTAESLDEISSICMDAQNLTFFFDEAHKVLGAGYAPPHFLNVLQEGRHKRVSVVLMAHRLARIPKDFTEGVDNYYLFQTAETVDLEDIAERCGERVAHRVMHLRRLDLRGENPKPGQYYHLDTMTRIGKLIEAGSGKVVAIDDLGLPNQGILKGF